MQTSCPDSQKSLYSQITHPSLVSFFKKNTIQNKWVSQTKRASSATLNAYPPSPDTSRSSLGARNRNPNARCQMQKPCSAVIRTRIRDLNARCKKTNAMPCRARARTRHPNALYVNANAMPRYARARARDPNALRENANAMLCYPRARKCHPRARTHHLNARWKRANAMPRRDHAQKCHLRARGRHPNTRREKVNARNRDLNARPAATDSGPKKKGKKKENPETAPQVVYCSLPSSSYCRSRNVPQTSSCLQPGC